MTTDMTPQCDYSCADRVQNSLNTELKRHKSVSLTVPSPPPSPLTVASSRVSFPSSSSSSLLGPLSEQGDLFVDGAMKNSVSSDRTDSILDHWLR